MRRENAGRYECDCDITDYPEKRERERRDCEEKESKKGKKGGREGEREKIEYTSLQLCSINLWQP